MKKSVVRISIGCLEVVYKAGELYVAVGLHPLSQIRVSVDPDMLSGFLFLRASSDDRYIEAEVRAAVKQRWGKYVPSIRRSHTHVEVLAKAAKESGQ